jgi:small-conductance mechanosensitive channel
MWLQSDGFMAVAIIVAAALFALSVQRGLFVVLQRFAGRRVDGVLAAIVRRANAPTQFIFPLVAIEFAVVAVRMPGWLKEPLERALGLGIIAAVAWALIALVELATDLAKRRYRLDEEDNLHARQVETRLDILNRVATTLVLVVGVSLMLMTFPPIRAVGASLLASAGLVGLVAGLAARPFFENLVAGLQIALTQPIRIDDVVVVQSETGRIEKITETYVVVRLWDLRRMILPLTYFLETPFQNWTYSSANLVGSVLLYPGYGPPIDKLRQEAERIVKSSPLWDGNECNVAMTDAKESTPEIRVLVSAGSSSRLFDLRCYVRERLVAFVQEHYPAGTPTTRVELTSTDGMPVLSRALGRD